LGGATYFVSFIDDYSTRLWVYPIKKKSDVFSIFKVFKAQIKLEIEKKIKCLRTDNGGEYVALKPDPKSCNDFQNCATIFPVTSSKL